MPDKPPKKADEQELPSIPDGGLSESMPDWLRRPPAWRTLPDREVVIEDPANSSTLPDADTSEIDPRTLISDDDLPDWLRSLRQPSTSATGASMPAPPPQETGSPGGARQSPAEKRGESKPHSPSAAFRPRQPAIPSSLPAQRSPTPERNQERLAHQHSWWEGAALTASLGAALLIAIIVIILLVVA